MISNEFLILKVPLLGAPAQCTVAVSGPGWVITINLHTGQVAQFLQVRCRVRSVVTLASAEYSNCKVLALKCSLLTAGHKHGDYNPSPDGHADGYSLT